MELVRISTLSIFLIIAKCGTASPNFNLGEVVWLPNPLGEGLIPAKLTPTPGAKIGNISDIHFLLFTKANKDEPDEIWVDDLDSIENSHFVAGAPLKFMVHGFGGNTVAYFPRVLKDAYLREELDQEFNIILMDYTLLSDQPDFWVAYENAQLVSQHSANLFKFLVDNGKSEWSQIHLIGHSLGAQIVGQIGHRSQGLGGMINHITSLDPAMPFFDVASPENRTTPDDATFVEVMHTAANGVTGWFDPCGHVDWYPNGGRYQAGCGVDFGSCSHERASVYYIESVTSNVGFWGKKCENYEQFENGDCDSNEEQLMAHGLPHSARGTYFSKTNNRSPFALGPGNLEGK